MKASPQIDDDIALYRLLLRHPESWETEDLLELVSVVKLVHTALGRVPLDRSEEYQRAVDELDEELRAIARAHPDVFLVYSNDWTARVNILEDQLGWDL